MIGGQGSAPSLTPCGGLIAIALSLREKIMARTSTRGWKGCPMCKSWKDRANGDPIRFGRPGMWRASGGRRKRFTRRTIPADQMGER
jgi:hypothetical protein